MNQQNANTNNNNKWFLMLCELHYPTIHGQTADSCSETHYLVYDRFDGLTGISFQDLENVDFDYDTDEEYDSDDDIDDGIMTINKSMMFLKDIYINHLSQIQKHPTIRNYHNIISRDNYIKPEIGEYIILPSQEAIAILKTFWLRIIQRTWKKVFKKRQNIIKYRSNPASLYIREITGRWNYDLVNFPGLRGMLYQLKQNMS